MGKFLGAALLALSAMLVPSAALADGQPAAGATGLPQTAQEVFKPLSCWAGASVGRGITATRQSDVAITVQADGITGGVEAGCDVNMGSALVIGGMARYEWLDISSRIGGAGIGSDAMWTVALRSGVRINPDLLAYGMLGLSGTDLSMPGLNWDSTGITYGAGLEVNIAETQLSAFAEWSHTQFDDRTDGGVKREPESDTVRAGIRYRFNGPR